MSKIIRSTAISGSRKLSGEPPPVGAASQKGRKDTDDEKARPEVAPVEQQRKPPPVDEPQPVAPLQPQEALDYRDGAFDIDRSLIENLKAETLRLQAQCDKAQRALAEKTQELEQQQRRESGDAFDKGYRDGQQQGEKLWQEKLQILDTLLTDMSQYGEHQIGGLDKIAAEIAYTALCRLVGERAGDRDFIIAVVKTVLGQITDDLPVKVRVCRSQYALIEAHKNEFEHSLSTRGLEIVADPRVTAGGCILEADTGSWDGRLETQLQRLKDALVAADRGKSTS